MFFTDNNKRGLKKTKSRGFYYPMNDYTSTFSNNNKVTTSANSDGNTFKTFNNVDKHVDFADDLIDLLNNNTIIEPGSVQHAYPNKLGFNSLNEDSYVVISGENINNKINIYYKSSDKNSFYNSNDKKYVRTPFFLNKQKPVLFYNKIIKVKLDSSNLNGIKTVTLQFPKNNSYEFQFNLYQNRQVVPKFIEEKKNSREITITSNHVLYFRINTLLSNENDNSYKINIINEYDRILDSFKVITKKIYNEINVPKGDLYVKKLRIQTNNDVNLALNSKKSWSLQRLQLWVKNKSILYNLGKTTATGFNGKGIEPKVISPQVIQSIFNKNAIISNTVPKEDFSLYENTYNSLTGALTDYTYRSGINEILTDNRQFIEVELSTPIHYNDIQYLVIYSNNDDNRYPSTEKLNYIFNTSVVFFDNYNNEISEKTYDLSQLKPDMSIEEIKNKVDDNNSIHNSTIITLKGNDHESFLKNSVFEEDTEYTAKLKAYYKKDYNKEPNSNEEKYVPGTYNYVETPWYTKYMDGLKHVNFMSSNKVYFVNNDINEFIRELN